VECYFSTIEGNAQVGANPRPSGPPASLGDINEAAEVSGTVIADGGTQSVERIMSGASRGLFSFRESDHLLVAVPLGCTNLA
jgi:hypothetical protein